MGGGRMRLNLTQRFIVYLIVLSILPLLVVGLSAIHLSNQALEHETRSSAIQQAHDKAALLNGQMAKIEATAKDFEAVFITEMLKPMMNMIEVNSEFGGGKGEEIFRDFTINEYGKKLSAQGGIGIAKHVKDQLIRLQEAGPNS